MKEPRTTVLRTWTGTLLKDAAQTTWCLVKIMIPLGILSRLLAEYGMVERLGTVLSPAMRILGLPGPFGLVWATGLVVNLYGAIAVLVNLSADIPITTAQLTVLTTVLLVAHGLPIETRIAQRSGLRPGPVLILRIGGALLLGRLLHVFYSRLDILQEPVQPWIAVPAGADWTAWFIGQAKALAMIFLVILGLLLFIRILTALHVVAKITRTIEPLLRLLGMGPEAAPTTVIGMVLGLSYGGGLIIRDAQSGRLSNRDVFFALTLMGLCHSLIEDTLLMVVVGAHVSGVLWARLLFSLVTVSALAAATRLLREERFAALLCRAPMPPPATERSLLSAE